VHAAHIFSQLYADNIVEWDGYFIDFKQPNRQGLLGNSRGGQTTLLVKMNPSESDTFADIVISMSNVGYQMNKSVIDSL